MCLRLRDFDEAALTQGERQVTKQVPPGSTLLQSETSCSHSIGLVFPKSDLKRMKKSLKRVKKEVKENEKEEFKDLFLFFPLSFSLLTFKAKLEKKSSRAPGARRQGRARLQLGAAHELRVRDADLRV